MRECGVPDAPTGGENRGMNKAQDACRMFAGHAANSWRSFALAAALIAACFGAAAGPAFAQAIVASINGDPITNIDIDDRMKMLRVLHKPATREAAIESLFSDRLKSREAGKFSINPQDSDLSPEIVSVAKEMKVDPRALIAALEHAGVPAEHFKAYFRAEYAFSILVQALNKGVEASEEQVRAELAKQGGKAASGTEYTVRQVIFAVPHSATAAALTERGHEAENLREKFLSCESGIPIAQAITDVTVRDPIVKTAIEIDDRLRQLLDSTPAGHLTAPSRTTEGIEMIAVCNKGQSKDNSAARAAIEKKILDAKIAADSERRLKELRAKAVVVKY
jgi:peptidyl-prolyl cis-trans isomerase SurA